MSGPFCYRIHTYARGRCDTREEIPDPYLVQGAHQSGPDPGVMMSPLPDGTRRIVVHPPALLPSPESPGDSAAPEGEAVSRPHSDTSEARKLGTLVDVSQALDEYHRLHYNAPVEPLAPGKPC